MKSLGFVAIAIVFGGIFIVTIDAVIGKFQFKVIIKYEIELYVW